MRSIASKIIVGAALSEHSPAPHLVRPRLAELFLKFSQVRTSFAITAVRQPWSRIVTAAMLACIVYMLASAQPALGFELAEAEVRSALGQPLRIRIPYHLAKDEAIDASCVRVSPAPAASSDIPTILKVRASLQSQAGKNYIVLESPQAVNDPAARLTVEVRCGTISSSHEFVVLFDPPKRFAPSAAAAAKTVAKDGTLAAPQSPAVVREPQQPADQRRPVVGREPALQDSAAEGTGGICCLQLSYELTGKDIPPLAEDQREPLRQGMREPTSDENSTAPVQMVRNELPVLTEPLTAPAKELAAAQTLHEQQATQGRAVNYMYYTVYFVVALALILALWQWLSMKRRRDLQPVGLSRANEVKPDTAPTLPRFTASTTTRTTAFDMARTTRLDLTRTTARNEPNSSLGQSFDLPAAKAAGLQAPAPDIARTTALDMARDEPISILGQSFDLPAAKRAGLQAPAPDIARTTALDMARDEPISILGPEFNLTAASDAAPQAPVLDFDLSKAAVDASSLLALDLPVDLDSTDQAQRATGYQKAYVLARFPEIAAGNIVLHNPASVIEAARIFYQEDNDAAKAEELLRIAIAADPKHVRVWLTLFEIFSRERMAPEFSQLARRYRDARDIRTDEHWPMIAKIGRELEPGNELFSADGLPPVDGPSSNWLNSQLDMQGELLALELRTQMMEQRDKTRPAVGK